MGSPKDWGRVFCSCLVAFVLCAMTMLFDAVPASAIPTYHKAVTCDFPEQDIECGIVRVFENRSSESGSLLELNIYVIKSPSAEPASDPIVVLTGGPGIRAKDDVYTFYDLGPLRRNRDIIIVDQRGTDSRTDLCPDVNSDRLRLIYSDLESEEIAKGYARRLEICFDNLRDYGRDVDAINNRASALDIRDLRIALGIDQWNVLGVSYGTALGLEVMTIDRDGIRAAVLDSLSPIDIPWDEDATANYYESLVKLSRLCLASFSCSRTYGDLFDLRTRAVESLTANPLSFRYFVDVNARARGTSSTGVLNDHDLTYIVGALSYFEQDVNLVPLLLQAVLDRDSEIVSEIVTYQIERLESYTADDGTLYAVACGLNDMPDSEVSTVQSDKSETAIPPYDDLRIGYYCGLLGLKPLPKRELLFDRVTMPTLLMSGEYDPVTPPKWGAHVEGLLPNAQHLVFPHGFHSVSSTPCGNTILAQFIDDPERELDVSCADDDDPIVFAGGLVGSRIGEKFWGYEASPLVWVGYALPVLVMLIWLMVQGATAARFGTGAVSHANLAILLASFMLVYAAWLIASLAQTYALHWNIVWMGIGFVPLYTSLFTWMTPIGLIAGPVLAVQSVKEMRKGTLAERKGWERIAVGVSVLVLCLLLVRDGVVPDLIRFF